MTAVFLMQPLGQLISQLVGLWVLLGYNNTYNLQTCSSASECGQHVDSIWRWVAGVGAIPAIVAIYYRFQIPDPGLYDLDVTGESTRALQSTLGVYPTGDSSTSVVQNGLEMQIVGSDHNDAPQADEPLPAQFSWGDIRDYFWEQGNWRSLAGTSACWFLLDM